MVGDAARMNAPATLSARLAQALEERRAQGLERTLRARASDEPFLDLANNDYLRLSQHPAVKAAAVAATERWGCSSSGSPLITGYTAEHDALLDTLKQWCGFPCGLIWNTGFAANAAILSGLPRRGDLVLADRLIHNSMISGLLASGARLQRYRHLDLDHLRELLEKNRAGEGAVFVVSETVYSMDGDYPDLHAMAALKERYGFVWILDEAHALGWYGRTGSGLIEAAGVTGAVDVMVGTLGKGLGSMGAFTLFQDEVLRRYLINHAGEFIYSTYLPPACAAAARQAVELLRENPGQCDRLHALSRVFRQMLPGVPGSDAPDPERKDTDDLAAGIAAASCPVISTADYPTVAGTDPHGWPAGDKKSKADENEYSDAGVNPEGPANADSRGVAGADSRVVAGADSPIVPVRVPDPVKAAAALLEQGIRVGAIRPPTVPAGEGRLRISLNAELGEADLKRVAAAVNAVRA